MLKDNSLLAGNPSPSRPARRRNPGSLSGSPYWSEVTLVSCGMFNADTIWPLVYHSKIFEGPCLVFWFIPDHAWAYPPPSQRLFKWHGQTLFPSPPTLKGPVGPCCYSFHSTLEAQSSTTCVTSVNTVPSTKVNLNLPTTVLLTCYCSTVPFASAACNQSLRFLYKLFYNFWHIHSQCHQHKGTPLSFPPNS